MRRDGRLRTIVTLALGIASACGSDGVFGTCQYCGGAGLLFGEYLEEENEKDERLAECGECPAGQRCNLLSSPAYCRADPGEVGDPCGRWRDRVPDEFRFDCAAGLVCNPALDPPTCRAPGPAGTPCHTSDHCDAASFCDAQALECRPTFPRGSACTSPDECRPLTCYRGVDEATCTDPKGVGASCRDGMDCTDELFCASGPPPRCTAHTDP